MLSGLICHGVRCLYSWVFSSMVASAEVVRRRTLGLHSVWYNSWSLRHFAGWNNA